MNAQLLLTGALVGLLATVVMDISSLVALRLGLAGRGPSRTGYHLIGRWYLYLLRGRISHTSILTSPPLPQEAPLGALVHYAIGAFLGAFYFALLQLLNSGPTLLNAVAFGLGTTVLPWFYLYPTWGYGWLGANAQGVRMTYFSLINHTFFGLGIALWATLLHPS
jgi:hypothetical protein